MTLPAARRAAEVKLVALVRPLLLFWPDDVLAAQEDHAAKRDIGGT